METAGARLYTLSPTRRSSDLELPQLFNVMFGQMSVVGPRPERPVFVNEFRRLLPRYDERHLVRPGITGWSQVNMRRVLQRSEEHTSELQSHVKLVCRLLLEKK